ncbi:DUF2920 family protein, partial [Campylobacter coli]
KLNQKLNQNYKLRTHVSFLPSKNEYQNFGIMQAMDILNAIFYIKENSPFKLMGGVLERFCLEIHMADI